MTVVKFQRDITLLLSAKFAKVVKVKLELLFNK